MPAMPAVGNQRTPAPPTHYQIAEFELHPGARVNRVSGEGPALPSHPISTRPKPLRLLRPKRWQSRASLTSLRSCAPTAHSIGRLRPAAGRILRIGYSLLGTTNHPASPEATGLEVDKLSKGTRQVLPR